MKHNEITRISWVLPSAMPAIGLTLNPTGNTGSRISNPGSDPSPRNFKKVFLAPIVTNYDQQKDYVR